MEPTIKYENCDEIYAGPAPVLNDRDSCGIGVGLKRAYSEISDTTNAAANNNNNNNTSYQLPNSYQVPLQSAYQQRGFFHAPPLQQQQQQQSLQQPQGMAPHAATAKRSRRVEGSVLFAPPFFELSDMEANGGTLTARCLSCHVMLRGHRNVSSNFIKHMKRVHPEMHKIYEGVKLFKHRGYAASELNMKWNSNGGGAKHDAEANLSSNNVCDSAEPPFFDANIFLDNMSRVTAPAADEEHNSETTDNSPTPPDSNVDALETTENSVDSQQPLHPIAQVHAASEKCRVAVKSAENTQVDLSQKTLQLMSRMFDDKLKAFVTKTEFDATTQVITNLVEKKTTPNASVDTQDSAAHETAAEAVLETKFDELQQQYQTLAQRLQQTEHSKRHLQNELETLDRQLRRRKLIVRNLKVEDNEKPQEAVEQLIRVRLQLPDLTVQKVTTLTGGPGKTQNGKHNLLIELQHENDAGTIFRQCSKLRGSGIFIEPEMSLHARRRKEKLLVLRKELLRRNNELKVVVRNTQLFVCGRQFYWDEVEGLCAGNLNCVDLEETDAVEQLKQLTKLDLKEFLNVLKNYNVR